MKSLSLSAGSFALLILLIASRFLLYDLDLGCNGIMTTFWDSWIFSGGSTIPKDYLGYIFRTRWNGIQDEGIHDKIDDFIRKVFEQWLEWRDTISFIHKQSTRIEDYVKQIEELKKKKQ